MLVDIKGDGYYFKGNTDCNNKMGVILDVNFIPYNQVTEILLVVDIEGNIIAPAYKDKSLGFIPLLQNYNTKEGIDTFYRSNRSLYGVVGSFVMIVHGTVGFDKDTEELIEEKLSFYMPKSISINFDNVVCDKVDDKKGINTFVVNSSILNAYKNRVLSSLNKENMKSKLDYMSSLIINN